jgi:hypothetical protein
MGIFLVITAIWYLVTLFVTVAVAGAAGNGIAFVVVFAAAIVWGAWAMYYVYLRPPY